MSVAAMTSLTSKIKYLWSSNIDVLQTYCCQLKNKKPRYNAGYLLLENREVLVFKQHRTGVIFNHIWQFMCDTFVAINTGFTIGKALNMVVYSTATL